MIQLVPHYLIAPSPLNPRKSIAEEALAELAESIKAEGLLQNLVVRPNGDGYEIAAGERRWRAIATLIEAGDLPDDHQVPVVVRDLDDLQLLQLATTENLARADMSPLEEARAFARMLELGSDVATISAETGLSERTVRTRLILVERLGEKATQLLEEGTITLGAAQALTALSVDAQERLIQSRTYYSGEIQLDANDVRAYLRSRTIPVSRAAFPLERYQGEITSASLFDPDSEPSFTDVDQFHQLQKAHAEEIKAEAERQGKWAEIVNHYSRWETPKLEELDEEDLGDFGAELGVVISVSSYTGELQVHEDVVRRKQSYSSSSASSAVPERDPRALTEKHRSHIQYLRTLAAQKQVASNGPALGLRLAIAALVTSNLYSVRIGHSRGLSSDQLHPAAREALDRVDKTFGLDPEIVYMSVQDQVALTDKVLATLAELDTPDLAQVLSDLTSSLIHFGVDGTWVDGQQRDLTSNMVMSYVDGEAALPTWRELGADWLLLYPKARLEEIYAQATGREPGASLTRKNLAAGILDHATPGWLDQVPAELLLEEEREGELA